MTSRTGRACGRAAAAAALAALTLAALGVGADEPAPSPATMDRAALEAALARDQARIEELLIEPRDPDDPPLHDDAELRQIAQRMPALQRALREMDPADESLGASDLDREDAVAAEASDETPWTPSIELPPVTSTSD